MKNRAENSVKSKKSGRLLTAAAVVLFIAGLAVLLYPRFTNWLYNNDVERQMESFDQLIEEEKRSLPSGSAELPFEELYQELKRQNEKLFAEKQSGLRDAFSYSQPAIDLSRYGLEGSVIGFIHIPRMEVTLPILLGANTENLSLGAAHLTETSYPTGGENTNCVLAGHRGFRRSDMFRHIERLEIGDEIYIRNFRETLVYRVAETKVILPDDVHELLIQPGRDLVTLVTCHPYRHNYQRYVVYCERVES